MFTLQEFNESLNIPYRLDAKRVKTVFIEKQHKNKLHFTKENVVLVHLLTQTALAMPKKHESLLIPSNFVVIEFNSTVDAQFFEWYFNEHPMIRKQIARNTQGAVISTLSIANLRELEVDLPLLEKQRKIGRISQLQRKKNILAKEKMFLERMLIKQTILNQLEE
ncbi:restriction endonuclease subunit S [Sporosarcina sp. 6E9]|uniref:restriction endonuclease subunit S n=1 Tax=Sporosarcina sp. 6E9 TaxID=2819235 RepID=UPI001B3069F1|nr:restriction endonuclease subunit S [Sporosarcina sp. 6E9]